MQELSPEAIHCDSGNESNISYILGSLQDEGVCGFPRFLAK